MQPRITARVEAIDPWIDHGHAPRYPASKIPAEARPRGAKRFLGIGTPVEPAKSWTCGTDLVWPVYEINGQLLEPDDTWGIWPYVCRHQIVAGD